MTGQLTIVGVGPGDPDLMTLKGLRALESADVLLVPHGREDGNSTALAIVAQAVDLDGKEIVHAHFPMRKIRLDEPADPQVEAAWRQAARQVIDRLERGLHVVFPTLGDPAIYSTGFYLWQAVVEQAPQAPVSAIPGVSSLGACAAASHTPLCLGDDLLAVVPATYDDERIEAVLRQFDTIVLMKVHRVLDRIVPMLRRLDLLDRAILVERTAQDGERITRDLDLLSSDDPHYFTTLIVRKR